MPHSRPTGKPQPGFCAPGWPKYYFCKGLVSGIERLEPSTQRSETSCVPVSNSPRGAKLAASPFQTLAIAYHLKDELNEIWEQDDQEAAQALLLDWIVYAESTGIRMLQQFAKTLRSHAFGILAWYDYPISTGPLEGTNNKIKTMKRQAYGFRDPEFLRLKILGIHETTYALVG